MHLLSRAAFEKLTGFKLSDEADDPEETESELLPAEECFGNTEKDSKEEASDNINWKS